MTIRESEHGAEECAAPGCYRKRTDGCRGLCPLHHHLVKEADRLDDDEWIQMRYDLLALPEPSRKHKYKGVTCSVAGCEVQAAVKGLCRRCYNRANCARWRARRKEAKR